jgi:hypothetical protein
MNEYLDGALVAVFLAALFILLNFLPEVLLYGL